MSKRIKGNAAHSLSVLRPYLTPGTRYRLALKISDIAIDRLNQSGCPEKKEAGTAFLPSAIGKHTLANSRASEQINKSGSKETVYRMVLRSWKDWHGQPHSGIVSHPYPRWPRVRIPAKEEHLQIMRLDSVLHIASNVCTYSDQFTNHNIHTLNLFFELFGECDIFSEEGANLAAPKIKKLNWDLLPQGEYPWERSKSHIETITRHLPDDQRQVIEHRIMRITGHNPDFLAVGRGGFLGYFVFGFSRKKIFVMESIELDNATYIFGVNWESLSQLSKSEIISNNLQLERLIHDKRWRSRLGMILR